MHDHFTILRSDKKIDNLLEKQENMKMDISSVQNAPWNLWAGLLNQNFREMDSIRIPTDCRILILF